MAATKISDSTFAAPSEVSQEEADKAKKTLSSSCDEVGNPKKISVGADAKIPLGLRRMSTMSSLTLMALVIFLVDYALLGQSGQASASWFSEALGLWQSMSSGKYFAFDCCCALGTVGLVGMQLYRRFPKQSSKQAQASSPVKKIPARPRKPSMAASEDGPRNREGCNEATDMKKLSMQPRERTEKSEVERKQILISRWNKDIDAAARKGDVKKATQLLLKFHEEGQEGCKPDVVSYNLVIRACARRGDYKSAEKWFRHMLSYDIQASLCTYNTLLDACAKADSWAGAEACESWLEKILKEGIQAVNVISYATVVYAWARRGEEARAEKWMRKMVDDGIEPDAVSYNSMIHGCGVCGNPAGAERWIEEMQSRGIQASVTTYTTLIDACAKGGDVKRAERFLELMLAAEIEPNVVSFASMIDACAKKADPDRAEYWHGRMIECNVKPNAHSFSAVINASAKAGDLARAEEWLSHAEEAGIVGDVVIYSSVIDACGKVGDADRAVAIFRRMCDNGVEPHIVAYAALARPFAYRGDYVEVERIAKEMASRGIYPNEYFLYAQLLSYATCRPRQDQRAEQCFREALRSGLKANDHVVGALVRAVGRERCGELMQELCNGREVPVVLAPGRGGQGQGYKAKHPGLHPPFPPRSDYGK